MNESQARQLVQSVTETYDSIASHFDLTRTKIWPEFRYFTPFLRNSQRVLDVGCGNGRSVELFENLEIEYWGVDSSKKMVEIAQDKQFPDSIQTHFMQANVLDLSAVLGKFDLALMVAVLQHIPSQLHDQAIEQVASKLKPGGILLMTNWNLWQKKFLKMRLPNLLERIKYPNRKIMGIIQKDLSWKDFFVRYQKDADSTLYHRYHFALTSGYMRRLLTRHGFKIIRNEYTSGFKKRNILSAKNLLTIAVYQGKN